ncbi:hypothetical protein C5167_001514 [Papaver somniferum]|uniref:Uncharacterized protein n=1 Tax=Papaver somniferum TaxID=3469 RepID=A0A4Y7KZI0_PAPSO|nr:hypothetical protein C5167_001514 [Papaver somniferum]
MSRNNDAGLKAMDHIWCSNVGKVARRQKLKYLAISPTDIVGVVVEGLNEEMGLLPSGKSAVGLVVLGRVAVRC